MRVTNSPAQGVEGQKTSQSSKAGKASAAGATDKSESAEQSKAAQSGDAKSQISAKAREFAKAKEAAGGAPDVREEKIAALKARIASGKYTVDPDAIADKLVDDHVQMSGIG